MERGGVSTAEHAVTRTDSITEKVVTGYGLYVCIYYISYGRQGRAQTPEEGELAFSLWTF